MSSLRELSDTLLVCADFEDFVRNLEIDTDLHNYKIIIEKNVTEDQKKVYVVKAYEKDLTLRWIGVGKTTLEAYKKRKFTSDVEEYTKLKSLYYDILDISNVRITFD